MGILLLAAFWLIIGLLVFFVAMRGGPRGVRQSLHGQSRRGRRGATLVITLVCVGFGIAIPVAVLATIGSDHAKHAHGGVILTADEVKGRDLFHKNCASCHTLSAVNAVGKVGPNLDQLRSPAVLILNAIQAGRARGRGQMPANLLQGTDAKNVAKFVVAVAGH